MVYDWSWIEDINRGSKALCSRRYMLENQHNDVSKAKSLIFSARKVLESTPEVGLTVRSTLVQDNSSAVI